MWVLARVLAAFYFLSLPPVFADCARILSSFEDKRKPSLVELQTEKVRQKLSSVVDSLSGIELRHSNDDHLLDSSDYSHEISFGYSVGSAPIQFTESWVRYEINDNGGLEAYFRIAEPFRNKGLSKLLLLKILEQHPEIKSLETTFVEQNMGVFVTAMASRLEGAALYEKAFEEKEGAAKEMSLDALFVDEFRELSSQEDFKLWRDRVIKAIWQQTPAGRLRTSLGFAHTDRIDIVLTETSVLEVDFSVTQGESNSATEIRVVDLSRNQTLILSEHGKTQIESSKTLPELSR